MRKSLVGVLAVLFLLALGTTASGQSFLDRFSEKGVRLGLNLSNGFGDDFSQTDMTTSFGLGPSAGGFATYGINDQFGVGIEILYTMRNVGVDMGENAAMIDLRMQQHAVEVPILAKYAFLPKHNLRPQAYLGPSLIFPVAHKMLFETQSGVERNHTVYNKAAFSLGVNIGAGASYPVGPGRITCDLRFDMDLLPANAKAELADLTDRKPNEQIWATPLDDGTGYKDPSAKHMVIMVIFGYAF